MSGLGAWFAAHEARGGDSDILVGRFADQGSPQWYVLPHADYDGIGAVGMLLSRSAGQRIPLLTLLPDDHGWPVFELEPWAELLSLRSGWPPPGPRRYSGDPEVLWWTAEELAALHEAARKRDVSANSQLLWATHRALVMEGRKAGIPVPRGGAWMVPVNLRRNPRPARFRGNIASFMIGRPGGLSPEELHQDLSDRLAFGEHWAQAANLSLLASSPVLLDCGLGLLSFTSFGFLGLFSNVGVWEVPELPSESWCVGAPSTDQTPLAIAILCVNGRLSMCGRSHLLPRGFIRRVLARCRSIILEP